jgi:RTX calcium-binding nonapeptide repeat (4 copies)
MAFFTFTTVSGTATPGGNLVQTAVRVGGGAEPVTVKLVDGFVTYYNGDGNWTSTGNPLSYYASNGIAASAATITGASTVATDLATFNTTGFVASANTEVGGFAIVNAAGAPSSSIDAFIANNVGAANGSLQTASLSASQYASLKTSNLLAANSAGVVALNATGASTAQVAAIVADAASTTAASTLATSAVSNLSITNTNLSALVAGPNGLGKIATEGATVAGATATTQALATLLIDEVAANLTKISSVTSVGFLDDVNITNANFANFASQVATGAVTNVNLNAGLTVAGWNTLTANAGILAAGSVGVAAATDATNLSVTNFLNLAPAFANNSVGIVTGGKGLDLYGATQAQLTAVGANAAVLTNLSVEEASLTPAQFALMASKIAVGEATVNALGATAPQVAAILTNLDAFNKATLNPDGVPHALTNLTISGAQLAALPITGSNSLASLQTATPAVGSGTLVVDASAATAGFSANAATFTNTMTLTGSSFADNVRFGGATVAQGGMGSDRLDATGVTASVTLQGGNAIDTLIGGANNDYIVSGRGTANYLTGGGGNDTFLINALTSTPGLAGNAKITDLNTGDKFTQWSGSTLDAYVADGSNFVAANGGAVNDAVARINAASYNVTTGVVTRNTAGTTIDLANATGTAGFTVTGGNGNDILTGSVLADSIVGGSGLDTIDGGAGVDTLTGGSGVDTFNITTAGGIDVITDLGLGGNDVVTVAAGAQVAATVVDNWVASGSANNGAAALTVNNAIDVTLTAATGSSGWIVSAAGNSAGSNLVGSVNNDTITGSNGDDFIAGGNGVDVINLGVDASIDIVSLETIIATTNRDTINNFVGGFGGDVVLVDAATYSAYGALNIENLASVNTLSSFANATATLAGGANGSNGINWIVADTQANILASDLSLKFALTTASLKAAFAYATDTGRLYYDADGNFSSGAVLVGTVTGAPTLTADNFGVA